MSNPKPSFLETWVLGADETGPYLLFDPVDFRDRDLICSDDDEFGLVEQRLNILGIRERRLAVHSTSWRRGKNLNYLTFMAIVDSGDFVRSRWPLAAPLDVERLLEVVGNPLCHDPARAPLPRDFDVLLHGLRHYALLLSPHIGSDDTRTALLGTPWMDTLTPLPPALAGLYVRPTELEGVAA